MQSKATNPLLYFLHIPKTAGGTLINILDSYFDERDIFPPLVLSELLQHPDAPNHFDRYRFVRGHFDYATSVLLPNPMQIITMLRNPVERTISQFEHTRRDPNARYWDQSGLINFETKIADFLATEEANAFLGNVQTRSFVSEWYGISRLTYWDVRVPTAPDNFLIELAKRRLQQCVFIGIQERFWESVCLLCFTLGFRVPQDFRDRNVPEARLHQSELSVETLEKLKDLNNLDSQLHEEGSRIFTARFEEMRSFLGKKYPSYTTLEAQIDAHYRQHHEPKERAPRRTARNILGQSAQKWRYDFNQPLTGKNWYPREKYQTFYSRWTGPEKESTLEWEIDVNKDVVLEIGSLGAISVEVLDSLQVWVNTTLIPMERLAGPYGPIFKGKVPASAFRKRFQVLRFKVSQTLLPDETRPRSAENRLLGISLYYIELKTAQRGKPGDQPNRECMYLANG